MRIRTIEKISLVLLLNLIFVFSVSAQNTTDAKGMKQGKWTKSQNGKKVYEGQFVDDVPVGAFLYFYPNGHLKIKTVFADKGHLNRTKMFFDLPKETIQAEGIYIDKKKDSVWNYYNENGKVILSENYNNGIKQGLERVYNNEGLLNLERYFQNDTLNGISTEYLENGAVFRKIAYRNGKMHGEFELYYPDGGLVLKGNYLNDTRDSIWTTYTKDGEIEFLDYYNKGLLLKRTDKNGNKLEFKQEEETIPLNIDPSVVDPTAIKR